MNKKTNFVSGFTLIELLVTIAIIAILTAIVMTNLAQPRAKARDAKRISDLAQIQLAVELYFDKCKQYPLPTGSGSASSLDLAAKNSASGSDCADSSGTVTLARFISKVPTPPASPLNQTNYQYFVNNGTGGNKNDYILHVKTEYTSDTVAKDSLPETYRSALTNYPDLSSFNCYDSSHTTDYCVGPK